LKDSIIFKMENKTNRIAPPFTVNFFQD